MMKFLGISSVVVGASSYSVKYEDVTLSGYVCPRSQKARVYYPVTDDKVPLISFAHGFTMAPPDDYATLHNAVAAAGYVVIHLESANQFVECQNEWKDQVRSMEWMKTSSLSSRVDWSQPTGIMGHSMGGGATYHTSSQKSAVETYNIAAAVALNPQIQYGQFQPIINPLVPIMYTSGTNDAILGDAEVKDAYQKTKTVPKVFADIKNGDHMEPATSGGNRLNEYSIAMMDCHIKGMADRCDLVYGSGTKSLCGGKVPMGECVHENEPASIVV